MAFGIEQLRNTGTPEDAVRANMLQAILDDRGEDIPLPIQYKTENDLPLAGSELVQHTTVNTLARYALADDAEKPPVLMDGEQIDEVAKMYTELHGIVQDLPPIVALKIPSATENKRDWKGKLVRKEQISWVSTETIGDKNISFNFIADYMQGKNYNSATSLTVYINDTPNKNLDRSPASISTKIENGSVVEISFTRHGDPMNEYRSSENRNSLMRTILWHHITTDQLNVSISNVTPKKDKIIGLNDLLGNPIQESTFGARTKGTLTLNPGSIVYTVEQTTSSGAHQNKVRREYDGNLKTFLTTHTDYDGAETTLPPTDPQEISHFISLLKRVIPTKEYRI